LHQHAQQITNTPESEVPQIPRRSASGSASVSASKQKLGRNDPCYCGSGKKYKKCHYPN
jgi:preprotein translocase subunit SecA